MFSIAPDNLIWIVIFIVPGFVASRVFALRCPAPKPELEKMILEFFAYSLFNLIGNFWLVIPIAKTPPEQWVGWDLSLTGLWVCFVSPSLLAILWAWIRTRSWIHHKLGVDHPTPRGWDHFLNHNRHFFILFHLKNGKMLGGYFGEQSYASTYPHEPEVYVEQIWRVDEIGRFVEMVPGTIGAVVRQADWERIEFLEVQYEGSNEPAKEGSEAVGTASGGSTGPGWEGRSGQGSTGEAERQQSGPGSSDSATGGIGNCAPAGEQPAAQEVGGSNEER